ncbi:uncharacterized protein K452DRAFT_152043 [Aplosporella prunicola CBS 121167]|uniref:Uncharacterized protein n=1 Tax=Aplosporella prunicola CBS 121167 TaxID=1176127 RepID=A0A6A6BNC7_9PEZI|nr:uncharacterized protein K452DRAFT_152043 [Aplosporella prunicola CBS 121167]KAF2144051.1 hypothetical protein K452DRAFT_152043 [Aplosporella prunicola CBS 121167]
MYVRAAPTRQAKASQGIPRSQTSHPRPHPHLHLQYTRTHPPAVSQLVRPNLQYASTANSRAVQLNAAQCRRVGRCGGGASKQASRQSTLARTAHGKWAP